MWGHHVSIDAVRFAPHDAAWAQEPASVPLDASAAAAGGAALIVSCSPPAANRRSDRG